MRHDVNMDKPRDKPNGQWAVFPKSSYKISIDSMCRKQPGLREKIFQGVRRLIPGPQILVGPPSRIGGPTPLNHFLFDGCRSSFTSEGITIFAYS